MPPSPPSSAPFAHPPRSNSRSIVVALLVGLTWAIALVVSGPSQLVVPLGADASEIAPARLSGVHGSESQYGRAFRWTEGLARLRWPSVVGVRPAAVELTLASFPGRAGDQVSVTVDQREVTRYAMSGDWDTLRLPVPTGADGGFTLEIQSLTHRAPGDARDLGVRLHALVLINATRAAVLAQTPWWHVLALTLVGALVVTVTGRLMGSTVAGVTACAGLGVLLWATRLTTMHVEAIRAASAALLLAMTVGAILASSGVSRARASVIALLAALPFVVLVTVAAQHFVPVPRWDVWDIVPLIEKREAGTLSVADLWRAHNAHRPFTGRALLLANVWLTRWNHWVDLAMILTTAALQLVVITLYVGWTQRRAARVHPASLVVVALFVFTLVQWENWLQGWQIVLLVGALAVSAALLVLSEGAIAWSRTALAAVFGLIATASFLSCLLVWPLGALAILVRRAPGWRGQLVAWMVITMVTTAVYVWDLPPDPSSGQMAFLSTWLGLRGLLAGVLVSVGTPALYRPGVFMGPTGELEWAVMALGAAAILLTATMALRRWHADAARDTTWLFPALLCLFGIGAGMLAAMGRVWMGVQAMTASRYVVFGSCVWIGLTLLLAMRREDDGRGMRVARAATLAAMAVLAATNWPPAMRHVEDHYLSSSQARIWLLRGDVHAAASVLFPDPFVLETRAAVLRQHGLSLYRPGHGP